jgi:3-isopropylmalate/(R)-2-methylmalate dehydratase small subunit
MSKVIQGPAYVIGDNIDTDQIIPAQYLMLVPTVQEEYNKLGSYALCGLPDVEYPTRFVEKEALQTKYPVVICGKNMGCGSSREHAPIAMGAAGCHVVIAETYARIFFRNCVATGEVFPYESFDRLINLIKTGDEVTIDFEKDTLTANGTVYPLKPLGDVRPVVEAGGLFNYARQSGMIAQAAP